MPTFEIVVEGRGAPEYGYTAFIVAFVAIVQEYYGGITTFLVWLANPAFWAGLVLFVSGRYGAALVASVAAMVLGCRFVFSPQILAGYYLWLGSLALLAGACAVHLLWPLLVSSAERGATADRPGE